MAIPNLLSLNFRVPFVAYKNDFSRAIRGIRGMPRRLLLVGHKLAGGTVPLNTIKTVSSEADAIAMLGEGSMLMGMWRAAKANADLGLVIDVFALTDGFDDLPQADLNFTIAGGVLAKPTELRLYVGGILVRIPLPAGAGNADVSQAIIAAFSANPQLPVTAVASLSSSQVAFYANWRGYTANAINIRQTYYPDDQPAVGLTVSITAFNGVGDPNLTPLIVAMQHYRATEIVNPFTDSANMRLLEDEMAARWKANNMQDGAVVTSLRGTEGQIGAWLANRNSPHVHTIATTKDMTSPWETAAAAGAAIESAAAIDPAVPHTGIRLAGYYGPAQGDGFTTDAINNLLVGGASPLQVNQDSTGNLLRMVTNYNQTDSGAEDFSMGELCWMKTTSYFRWFRVTDFQIKYQGFKLAQYITDPIPGQKIMTPELGEEICLGQYKLFMDVGLMQNMPYYQKTLLVEVDGPNGKLKIQDEPVLVTQHYQTEITSYVVAGQV
jgi:phage tail sheath gpL-like